MGMMVVDSNTETEMVPASGGGIYIIFELGGPTFSFCIGPCRLCRQLWMASLIGARAMGKRS